MYRELFKNHACEILFFEFWLLNLKPFFNLFQTDFSRVNLNISIK